MSTTSADRSAFQFQPRRAFAALRVLLANPDDTAQVFTIIEALSGAAPRRVQDRFEAAPSGRRLLAERPSLLAALSDRAALERMPAGSLAHAYLRFIDSEGITAGGLVEASVEGEVGAFRRGRDADFDYVSDRMRDTHDLWHTVTGYKGDLIGEAAVLAFSLAQTHNPGVGLIVLAAVLRARDLDLTRFVFAGFRRGNRAEWLPAVAWEELLALPLDEVRRRLRVEPVGDYAPMRSSWLRESGELAEVAARPRAEPNTARTTHAAHAA